MKYRKAIDQSGPILVVNLGSDHRTSVSVPVLQAQFIKHCGGGQPRTDDSTSQTMDKVNHHVAYLRLVPRL